MQIKTFTIPILGGEPAEEAMNVFLRSKKVVQLDNQLVSQPQGAYWCYCVKYVDDITVSERNKQKVDYREVLDEATFKRFSALRVIRKREAEKDGVPAYALFTDSELAAMSVMDAITPASLKTIKGISEKRIEKYGHHFLSNVKDEQG